MAGRRRAASRSTSCSRCSPRLDDCQAKERWATIRKGGGQMTMMAVETTVLFLNRYRSPPESGQP